MTDNTEVIVASVKKGHPSGQRCRAGIKFTETPAAAEVTAEQKSAIKADPFIIIHRRLSVSWFTGMKIDRTDVNEKRYAKEDPENWKETANLAVVVGIAPVVSLSQDGTQDGGNAGQSDDNGKGNTNITSSSNKATLIAALKAKGKIEGKDFDPAATNKALFSIYNS